MRNSARCRWRGCGRWLWNGSGRLRVYGTESSSEQAGNLRVAQAPVEVEHLVYGPVEELIAPAADVHLVRVRVNLAGAPCLPVDGAVQEYRDVRAIVSECGMVPLAEREGPRAERPASAPPAGVSPGAERRGGAVAHSHGGRRLLPQHVPPPRARGPPRGGWSRSRRGGRGRP